MHHSAIANSSCSNSSGSSSSKLYRLSPLQLRLAVAVEAGRVLAVVQQLLLWTLLVKHQMLPPQLSPAPRQSRRSQYQRKKQRRQQRRQQHLAMMQH
jgi:hypothetical protein